MIQFDSASMVPGVPLPPTPMSEMTTSTALSLTYKEPLTNGSPIFQWMIQKWQVRKKYAFMLYLHL
jgi:hypothetical protein